MKFFIIAGEPSGDLHGAKLMEALIRNDAGAEFCYWGGPEMTSVAPGKIIDVRETSIMGFWEVAKNLNKIAGFFRKTKQAIHSFCPDVIVLIDYPGFNLRMAKWAKNQGYKVVYYISPQVWAWKSSRVEDLRRFTDEVIVILPFEEKFLLDRGVRATYVGHPLVEVIERFKGRKHGEGKLALLPGSRRQEVERILPVFLEVLEFIDYKKVVIAGVSHLGAGFYQNIMDEYGGRDIDIIFERTYDLLSQSDFALVTSGTATLEVALFDIPQVVCYKTNALNFHLGKLLVKIPYISLVNLILDTNLVPELIQGDCTAMKIKDAVTFVKKNEDHIRKGYKDLYNLLDTGVPASDLAAQKIFDISKSS